MESRGAQRIEVNITDKKVRIESELIYHKINYPNVKISDEFPTVEKARNDLSLLHKTYDYLYKGLNVLLISQFLATAASAVKGTNDFLTGSDATTVDFLRLAGLGVIGLCTIIAEFETGENARLTLNKKMAVEETVENNETVSRSIYPF